MVYITGDIHGSLEPIYDLFERFGPSENVIVVILGDVGINVSANHPQPFTA